MSAVLSSGVRFDVNLSILFGDLPLTDRPAAARRAGFTAVESWWPFDAAVPADREVEAFVRAVRDAGVRLVLLNAYGGDLAAGDRGIAALPGREAEFRDNLDAAVGLLDALDCPTLHVLHGAGGRPELAVEHLDLAARAAAEVGAQVVVEALSGTDGYPLRTADDVFGVLDALAAQSDGPGARLLCDVYHLAVNGDDVAAVLRDEVGRIGHVQLADAPGRGRPGSGTLDLAGYLDLLPRVGYDGWVGLEYLPGTGDPFGWLPPAQRRS